MQSANLVLVAAELSQNTGPFSRCALELGMRVARTILLVGAVTTVVDATFVALLGGVNTATVVTVEKPSRTQSTS